MNQFLTLAPAAPVAANPEGPRPWTWVERGLFRFFFVYLLLYSVDVPLQIYVKAASKARQKLMEYDDDYRQWKMRQYARNNAQGAAAEAVAAEGDAEAPLHYRLIDPVIDASFKVMKWNEDLWYDAAAWVGKTIFDVKIPKQAGRGGSGDRLSNYLQVFTWACLALGVAVVWSLLDWWSTSYRRLHAFLRVVVRFTLAYWMIVYGAMKVIKAQFPAPSLDRLMEPFGEASPMGLVWTFMGHSEGYNFFAGMTELVGGLLLTTRRTTLLGALVTLGAMVHVASLNFFYDVPVKLFSLHLVFLALFLIAPDVPRLVKLLILNRPVGPAHHPALFRRWRWAHYGVIVLRTAFVAWLVWVQIGDNLQGRKMYGDLKERPPLYGLYHVDEFVVDGQRVPLPTAEPDRWLKVKVDSGFSQNFMAKPPTLVTVYLPPQSVYFRDRSNPRPAPDPSVVTYAAKIDPEKRTVVLTDYRDRFWKAEFTYVQEDPKPAPPPPAEDDKKPIPTHFKSGKLVWEGTLDGKPAKVVLQRVDDMYLLRRPEYTFRWIQEVPFNR